MLNESSEQERGEIGVDNHKLKDISILTICHLSIWNGNHWRRERGGRESPATLRVINLSWQQYSIDYSSGL